MKSPFCGYVLVRIKMASYDVTKSSFIDVVGALYHVALHQNRNAVFIWSVEMCFIFVEQINVIFMRLLYDAVILCDCIVMKSISRRLVQV